MIRRSSIHAIPFAIASLAVVACESLPPPPPPQVASTPAPEQSAAPAAAPPTEEEARAFLAAVDGDLRKLWTASSRAAWVAQNFITDDSEALSASAEEASMEFMSRTIKSATRFDGVKLPSDLTRQLWLLKIGSQLPAPSDPKERAELAETSVAMTGEYGKGKYCPERLKNDPKAKKKCLSLGDLTNIMEKSRKYDELLDAWRGWHSIAPPIKPKFVRYVELGNKGAREIGFKDLGELWRSGYDMPAADFEADTDRLWSQVKPLYDDLHCYVRSRLQKAYGKDKIPDKAPIPAHLLGNMWAQEWQNIYELVEPYKGEAPLDVTKKIKQKKLDEKAMVRIGEGFFVSLGLDPLPKSFWERSLFRKPADRDVVCHASAWDVGFNDDLRIKMCIEPKEDDLITIHHELGHDYYFHYYFKLPMLYQQGANDGFHEGIGDTLALSVTPTYLKSIGLLDKVPDNEKGELNVLLKNALDKVAFLPFGKIIDQWRWDVFSGKTPPAEYNKAWWELRRKYQGVAPPVARTEADFDPGAKYHVPGNTPYVRYFLARIYQFQFHRALCKAAGYTGPLHKCSIHGSKAAGDKLRAMLAMGASKPWPEALAAISGEHEADASAMLAYFAPLSKWLKEQNKGETCGW
ncbi:Peptidyl-dipeptidase A precursor [Minicystis rosea]|nr:Peptidyl-dipeptidase A precursor [Minicystis rosea]